VAVDNSGNVYIVGRTDGTLAGTSAGSSDAWVAKYNSLGTLQWLRQFGTPDYDWATSVAVNKSSGAVYITGFSDDDTGSLSAFLASYDSSGTLQWLRQWHSAYWSDPWYDRSGVAVDESTGDIYIASSTGYVLVGSGTGIPYINALLTKYDNSGTLQWTRQLGTGYSPSSDSVAVGSTGDVYVAGDSRGEDPLNVSYAWVAKYDSNGTQAWMRQLDTPDAEGASGVAVSGSYVYVTGYTTGDLAGTGAGQGVPNPFLARYDNSGALQWIRQLNARGSYSEAVATDNLGNIYITGENSGQQDNYIAKYNDGGVLQWARHFYNNGTSLGVAVNGSNIYVAGWTASDLEGAGTGLGNDNAWVAQFSASSSPVLSITGFTPTSGLPGTTVTLTGGNFIGTTSVSFNGPVGFGSVPASFTVDSSAQIRATVPNGATTGRITVTTSCDAATSATDFIVPNQ
jgi:hypothetical protein